MGMGGINLHPARIVRSNGEANAGVVYTFADVLEVFISRRVHSSTKLFGFERNRDDCRHGFREILSIYKCLDVSRNLLQPNIEKELYF